MDKVILILQWLGFYVLVGIINYNITIPPQKLETKLQKDYVGQHVSMIHALLAIILSFYTYLKFDGVDYSRETQWIDLIIVCNTMAYFIYDLIYAEYFGLNDWFFRIHHVFSLLGAFIVVFTYQGGAVSVIFIQTICALASEISNPFILSRKILRADGKEGTAMYNLHTTLFVSTFIFGRCFMGSFIVYNTWVIDLIILIKVSVSAVYLISLYWCYVIMRMSSKMMVKSGKENSLLVRVTRAIDKKQILLWLFLFVLSYVLPIYLTQVLKTGPFTITYRGFHFI